MSDVAISNQTASDAVRQYVSGETYQSELHNARLYASPYAIGKWDSHASEPVNKQVRTYVREHSSQSVSQSVGRSAGQSVGNSVSSCWSQSENLIVVEE